MNIDKTKQHFHLDIKFIPQPSNFLQGQFVYVDHDGVYKLAVAVIGAQSEEDIIKSNVQGVVWSNLESGFYLKTSFGPLKYREPFLPDYYNKDDNGYVLELEPNNDLIPGVLGGRLWLSTGNPGYIQDTESTILLGYKTSYGMLYRPEFVKCLKEPLF